MLEIGNVSFGYEKNVPVVRNLSCRLQEGRIYGLLGMNGAGKTTLLKLLSGLLFPDSGSIILDGKDVSKRSVETLQKIFYMPSEFRFPGISLEKLIGLQSVFYPYFSLEILMDCLESSGIGSEVKDLGKLSGGQKKKVMLAFALSVRTNILLMDEPLDGMDITSRDIFRKLLVKHTDESRTVVISGHRTQDMENLLTDVLIFRKDGTVFTGCLEELSGRYSFGVDRTGAGAVYAEPYPGGFRVIRENMPSAWHDTDADLEMLFNAVRKGVIR